MKLIFAFWTLLCALTFSPLSPAQAADFKTLAAGGAGGWLNTTRPLTTEDMQGRLVLLDFWTYGCVNCMNVVPDLEYLENTFGDQLLVIGVHSAKFKGEEGNDRILDAARRFGLKHPVINDSDYAIWKSYNVRAWPTFVLLGPDGKEIQRFIGEGQRTAMEGVIKTNLKNVTNTTSLSSLIMGKERTGTLSFPARLTMDKEGIIYIADSGHNRIVVSDQQGKIQYIIGSGQKGLKDGSYNNAAFNLPRGLALAGAHLYVADTNNHAIRRIDLEKKSVETIAGNGTKGQISSPWDLEPMSDGQSMAVAMAGRHQLWSLNIHSQQLSPLAGTGKEALTDGRQSEATLAQPSGLIDTGTALFFVDAESSALRVLEAGNVKTLIGTGLFDFGFKDGTYPEARLQHPQGLAADGNYVYIADTYNDAIRLYNRKSGELSTLALPEGSLKEPGDVLLKDRTLWIADTNHHALKAYNLDSEELSEISLNP